MIGWVEAAVDSGNDALFNKLPTMRVSSIPTESEICMFPSPSLNILKNSVNALKAKRRRNIMRKVPNQGENEYEAFVEKLQTKLKLYPMPVLTYEQSSFIDTSLPQFSDMTLLQEEIGTN